MDESTRHCGRCDTDKPLSEFYGGNNPYCRTCTSKYQRERRDDAPPEVIPGSSTVRPGPAATRWARWESYGATPEQVLTLEYLYQHGTTCDVCGVAIQGEGMHVDHCHSEQRIRGVLCGPHNQGLGMFQDSIEYMQAGITYLEKGNFSYSLKLVRE